MQTLRERFKWQKSRASKENLSLDDDWLRCPDRIRTAIGYSRIALANPKVNHFTIYPAATHLG